MKTLEELKQRVLEISRKRGLSHIGSNISCLPVLFDIYRIKKPQDKVVLSNAHSHLAHLLLMEDYGVIQSAEKMLDAYGIHCDVRAGCDASGGSLGHDGIATGMAIANPYITVFLVVSDGSSMEGSFFENLRIANTLNIKNLKIYCNYNGYTAVKQVEVSEMIARIKGFDFPVFIYHTNNGEGLDGVQGHYKILEKNEI